MRFLEADEVAILADAIHPGFYRPLILTAAYVGLRWGEIAGLRIESLNLLRRNLRVERQLIEVSGKLSAGPPKTKAGIRTVSIRAALSDVLAEHISTESAQRSGLVFPTTRGYPMRRSHFRDVWRRACTFGGLR
jgi:integrase